MTNRSLQFYIMGSILVVVATFTVIELATRIVSMAQGKGFTLALHELDANDEAVKSIYQWHPFIGFSYKQNISFTGSHPKQKEAAEIKVDKYGFLNPTNQLTYNKSPGQIRIATVGGSTTANLNLSYRDNWPGYLGLLVQKAFPDKEIQVINAGIPGFDTAQSIGNLALRVMPFKPDIVIIYHSYNDLKAIRKQNQFKPDYAHIHRKPFGYRKPPHWIVRLCNHSMLYVRLRNWLRDLKMKNVSASGKKVNWRNENRLSEIPDHAANTFKQHVQALVAIAKAGGAQVVLSSFATLHNLDINLKRLENIKNLPSLKKEELLAIAHFIPNLTVETTFAGIKKYNRILENVAVQTGVGWVDNAAEVPHEEKYFVDRVHFSRHGAELMARNLSPIIIELLKQKMDT